MTAFEPLAETSSARNGRGPGQDRSLVVGVDIGGTKTAILVCDRDGRQVARHIAPTAIGAPDRAADAIASLVLAALAQAGGSRGDVRVVGVGVPGRVDPARGEVSLAVNLGWQALPLGPQLTARLGRPVVLENDVRAAVLGLHRRRVFGDLPSLGLLAIGTGISAGVVVAGELHRGAHGLAGEIGHAVLDRTGPRCACGLRGCLEAIAAGPAILARALDAWTAAGTGPAAGGSEPPGAEAVFEAAAAGDPVAGDIIDTAGRAIAWGVHVLALAYDLEHIVIGGGVSHAGEPFMAPIRRELDRYRAESPLAAEILRPDLVQLLPPGADAGVWGAVTIAREALGLGSGSLGRPAEPPAVAPQGREVGQA